MIYHSFFKPDEYFVPVMGFGTDDYEISNYACLYDKKRNCLKLDNPESKETFYRGATLRTSEKAITIPFHQLMGICFLPNPEKRNIVNHKDRNRRNNALYNLEWATNAENAGHWHHYETARARLVGIGDVVFCTRTGRKSVVTGKYRTRYVEIEGDIEDICNIVTGHEDKPEYKLKLQEMIETIRLEIFETKQRRIKKRELKQIREGKK